MVAFPLPGEFPRVQLLQKYLSYDYIVIVVIGMTINATLVRTNQLLAKSEAKYVAIDPPEIDG